jgi:hypothetical protein
MRRVLPAVCSLVVLACASAASEAPTTPLAETAPPRPTTTSLGTVQEDGHEGEIIVSTCGPDRRGFVAPVRIVFVRGRSPRPDELALPREERLRHEVLTEEGVSFAIVGHGVCNGLGQSRPSCSSRVLPDNRVLLEADMCCENGASDPRPIGNLLEPPQAGTTCDAGPLSPGTYTLLFRGREVTTFRIPSIAHRSKLGRTFPLLPQPPDAGPPLDSASE